MSIIKLKPFGSWATTPLPTTNAATFAGRRVITGMLTGEPANGAVSPPARAAGEPGGRAARR